MISMELELAAEAPHDLILLNESFIALLIHLNQGLTSFNVERVGRFWNVSSSCSRATGHPQYILNYLLPLR